MTFRTAWVMVVMIFAACQPMYGKKAQKLGDPKPIKHTEPPIVVKKNYVERCDNVDFRRPVKGVIRNSKEAVRLVADGDAKLAAATTLPETKLEERKGLLLQSIGRYRDALGRDPYDADATLKLALAYHEVMRKGCALALLKRLDTLSSHPDFESEARRQKELVRDNKEWFADYREEALNQIP